MIKALYNNVLKLKRKNKASWKLLYKINKILVNIFYPFTQLCNRKNGICDSDVVVSLTTYPARVKTVWLTIASLLNQSYKPSKVLLYLSNEQFPDGLKGLPKKLLNLQNRGLEIVMVDGDLKPHKKYYYAFRDYKDKLVITADDDIFYPENHIEKLVTAAKSYPDAVICNRSHQIIFSEKKDGRVEFSTYNSWKDNVTVNPDLVTLPIGCNGVLYRPNQFDDEIFNIENIEKTSLFTDDLWLKAMEIRSGIKAYNCSEEPLVYFDNIFNVNTGLWHANTGAENRNDIAWQKIINTYPEISKKLVMN